MRLLRSFRLRIALLVTALASLVLIVFGSWAWIMQQRIGMGRLDAQLSEFSRGLLLRPGPPPDWQEVEDALVSLFGQETGSSYAMLVKDRNGVVTQRTENWPAGLSPDRFPAPTGQEFAIPPGPEESFGPPVPPAQPKPLPTPSERSPTPGGDRTSESARDSAWEEIAARERSRPGWQRGRRLYGRQHKGRMGRFPEPRRHDFFNWREEGVEWRIGAFSTPNYTLALGINMETFNTELEEVTRALLLAALIGLVLIAVIGYYVAQRALRPVNVLSSAAEGISARGLSERIPLENEDIEFQRLVNVFNDMLGRLERSFAQATRFSADAAHELKTPLTILQGQLEQGVQETAPGSAEQERYGDLLEEVQRLKSIIRKLLLLSMADAGQINPSTQSIDFSHMVEEACDDAKILGPDLKIKKEIAPGAYVLGDQDLLRQVVQNLTGNAVKYNRPKGSVWFHLTRNGKQVRLTIANTGHEIPEENRARIFERFYRVDKARSREEGGAGLGLSLARELARAHGGELRLGEPQPGITSFVLTLPAPPKNAETAS